MRKLVLIYGALLIITLGVYGRVATNEFINFDVEAYLTCNPHVATGLTAENFAWAFTSVEAGNWHPLTWLSHMVDVQCYGLNPRGHNLTSVAIHALSTLLLLVLLFRLTNALWQSSLVAGLFALHPLHVESVAWIAERKDVLSAFFWFLTLLCYLHYLERRTPSRYLLTLLSFVLGLLSKPMLVTLPLVMLLIDFWPLKRFESEDRPGARNPMAAVPALLREKVPFFACALLSGLVTIYAQHQSGAVASVSSIPVLLRLENAAVSYLKYLWLTLWPHDLALVYPFPLEIPLWQVAGSLLLLISVTVAVFRARESYPYLTVGWFWFLVTLAPVIGLIQVGSQSMADRYSYIPCIGLYLMAAWGVPDAARRLPRRKELLAVLSILVLGVCAGLTWHQLGYWRDSTTLYRRTLQVTTGNWLIHYNLGQTYARQGYYDAALQEYRESLRINPATPQAHAGLGLALAGQGNWGGAIQEYREALRLNPDYRDVRNNLGLALAATGDLDAAVVQYAEALRISPDYGDAHNNLGIALARKGDLAGALQQFQEALRSAPQDSEVQGNLARALALQKTRDGAK